MTIDERGAVRTAQVNPLQPDVRIRVPASYIPPPEEGPANVWQRFTQAAERDPGHVALVDDGAEMSYDELRSRAEAVAELVGEQVRGIGQPVAVVMENSIEAIVGILGVLASGNTYMPLDPTAPDAWLASTAEQAEVALVLGLRGAAEKAHATAPLGIQVVDLPIAIESASETWQEPVVPPESPARLVYTSGSTGDPKGVPRSHQHFVRTITSSIRSTYLSPEDRTMLLSHLSFGMANGVLFRGLLAGATVVLYDIKRRGTAGIADFIVNERITCLSMVPPVFRAAMAAVPAGTIFGQVRYLRLGADRVVPHDLELFRRHFPADSVATNGLGTSEVGQVTTYAFSPGTAVPAETVPIGYPHNRSVLLILDDSGDPVDPGDIGELVVQTPDALGYWNNREMTNAKFVPSSDGGFRYHTGDLVRSRPDGCLEYIGRKDLRAKVAGQAVEVAFVEDSLLRIVGIADAAAAAVPDGKGSTELVAYVVPDRATAIDAQTIRKELQSVLPPYMIPTSLAMVDSMPLNARGKVDRSQLAPTGATSVDGAATLIEDVTQLEVALQSVPGIGAAAAIERDGDWFGYYVPSTVHLTTLSLRRALQNRLGGMQSRVKLIPVSALPASKDGVVDRGALVRSSPVAQLAEPPGNAALDLETRVVAFFEDVLRVPVGPRDSFFDLGGTSLQAMEVFAKIDSAYGVNLSPTTIVEAPTPRGLAATIESHAFRPRHSSVVAIREEGSGIPTFHVHGGRGHVLHLHGLAQYSSRPAYGFEQPALHGAQKPMRRVEEMAGKYLADMRETRPDGPYVLMGHSFGGLVALEMARRLEVLGEEVPLLVIFDTRFGYMPRDADADAPARNEGLRFRQRLRRLAGRVRRELQLRKTGLELRLQRPVQYQRRTRYFYFVHTEASRRYRPGPYPGRVLVFSEQGRSEYHRTIWDSISPGTYEIIELPIAHGQLIQEPYIVDVMREIETRIAE